MSVIESGFPNGKGCFYRFETKEQELTEKESMDILKRIFEPLIEHKITYKLSVEILDFCKELLCDASEINPDKLL